MHKLFDIHKDGIKIYDTSENMLDFNIVENKLCDITHFNKNGDLVTPNIEYDENVSLLYSFGLMSDIHVKGESQDDSVVDYGKSLQICEASNCKFIAYAGDMTYNGTNADYNQLKTMMDTTNIKHYPTTGNHDVVDKNLYKSYLGTLDDYTLELYNDLFIFMHYDSVAEPLSLSRVEWLQDIIINNTSKRIFLIFHLTISGTSGDANGIYENVSYPDINPNSNVGSALSSLLNGRTNIIFCHGHTHLKFSQADTYTSNTYYNKDGYHSIHISSGCSPRTVSEDGTVSTDTASGEFYIVDVYKNRISFKPYSLKYDRFLTEYNFEIII